MTNVGSGGPDPTVRYGGDISSLQHYAMSDGCLEVDAEQPVHSDARCGRHYEVQAYVVNWLHVCM